MSGNKKGVIFVKHHNVSKISSDTIDVLHTKLKKALEDSKDSFSKIDEKTGITDNTFNSSLTFNKKKASQKDITEIYKSEIYTEINQKLNELKREMNNMNKQIKNIQITNTQKETEKTEIKDDIKESIKKENNEDMMEVKERLDKIEGLVSGFSNEINTIKAEMIVITNKINALKNNLFSLLESNLPLLEEIDEMKKAISELQDFHERAN